jgi:hypothetical protein
MCIRCPFPRPIHLILRYPIKEALCLQAGRAGVLRALVVEVKEGVAGTEEDVAEVEEDVAGMEDAAVVEVEEAEVTEGGVAGVKELELRSSPIHTSDPQPLQEDVES